MIQRLLLFISWLMFPSCSRQWGWNQSALPSDNHIEVIENSLSYDNSAETSANYSEKVDRSVGRIAHTVDIYELPYHFEKSVPFWVLQEHNYLRRNYNLSILRLSQELNALSEIYATKHASGEFSLLIDYPLKYGINVYYTSQKFGHPYYIIGLWANESFLYNATDSDEVKIRKMGHLSQMLGKDIEAIGVSMQKIKYHTSSLTFLLYILYDPPSINVEDLGKNVLNLSVAGTTSHQKPFVILISFLSFITMILKLYQ